MAFGSLDYLTEDQLAEAVEIDPAQIAGFGPSIAAVIAILEKRKQKMLETYETDHVQQLAENAFRESVRAATPPEELRDRFDRAVSEEHIADLDRLWYRVEQRDRFARQLVQINHHLGHKYQIEKLTAEYVFQGKQSMSIEEALEIKDELESIDRLIEQLKEAAKNAKIFLIDMEALARFADEGQMQDLASLQQHVQQLLEHMAA